MSETHAIRKENIDKFVGSTRTHNEEIQMTLNHENRFQWVVPLIEGIPPSPRGGHTATKVGRFLIIFGVFLKGPFLQRTRRRVYISQRNLRSRY